MDLYTFEFYLKENEDDGDVYVHEDKPDAPYLRCVATEISWWKYDEIMRDCYVQLRSTLKWSIDRVRKNKNIAKVAPIKIYDQDGKEWEKHQIKERATELMAEYYDYKCSLSIEEIMQLELQLEIYNDPKMVQEIKPPFDRMIVELDMARRIGGYTRQDIMSFSKKDLDKIYVLARSGMMIPFIPGLENYIKSPKNDMPDDMDVDEVTKILAERNFRYKMNGVI